MELETGILQEICDQIAAEIDAVVTVFGSRGRVVVSSKRERIGSFHERAAKIMAGEIDSVSVTAQEAALSSTMLEGCTSSIDFDGERLFCVGVAAPLDVAPPIHPNRSTLGAVAAVSYADPAPGCDR
jgi:sugar diacid utilization regulator